jgi:hypothetical protein
VHFSPESKESEILVETERRTERRLGFSPEGSVQYFEILGGRQGCEDSGVQRFSAGARDIVILCCRLLVFSRSRRLRLLWVLCGSGFLLLFNDAPSQGETMSQGETIRLRGGNLSSISSCHVCSSPF